MQSRSMMVIAIVGFMVGGTAVIQRKSAAQTSPRQTTPGTVLGQPVIETPVIPLAFVDTPLINPEIATRTPVQAKIPDTARTVVPSNQSGLAQLPASTMQIATIPPASLPQTTLTLAIIAIASIDTIVRTVAALPTAVLPIVDLSVTRLGPVAPAALYSTEASQQSPPLQTRERMQTPPDTKSPGR